MHGGSCTFNGYNGTSPARACTSLHIVPWDCLGLPLHLGPSSAICDLKAAVTKHRRVSVLLRLICGDKTYESNTRQTQSELVRTQLRE